MAEAQKFLDGFLSQTPAETPPVAPADKSRLNVAGMSVNEIETQLGSRIVSVNDAAMIKEVNLNIPGEKPSANDLNRLSGNWFGTQDGQFYQLQIEDDQAEFVRARVRPRFKPKVDENGDFEMIISGHAKKDGKTYIFRDDYDINFVWLSDKPIRKRIDINKHGKKVFVDGKQVRKGHRELDLGGEKAHLVEQDGNWEIVNDAVYQARQAKGGRKEAAAPTRDWKGPASAILKEVGAAASVFKPRDIRDLVSLTARALREGGGALGITVGIGLMISNLITIGIREGRTKKQIKQLIGEKINKAEEIIKSDNPVKDFLIAELFSGTGLTEKEINTGLQGKRKLKYLASKAYWRQTSFGKIGQILNKSSGSNLNQKEALGAAIFGVGLPVLFMATSR